MSTKTKPTDKLRSCVLHWLEVMSHAEGSEHKVTSLLGVISDAVKYTTSIIQHFFLFMYCTHSYDVLDF